MLIFLMDNEDYVKTFDIQPHDYNYSDVTKTNYSSIFLSDFCALYQLLFSVQ
jgi:hypothetical protein